MTIYSNYSYSIVEGLGLDSCYKLDFLIVLDCMGKYYFLVHERLGDVFRGNVKFELNFEI